jgi:hypothetical protein
MRQSQSLLGIASHIISIVIVTATGIFFVLAATGLVGTEMAEMTKNAIVKIWLVSSFLIASVALGLGLVGIFIKGKQKKYAFLGTTVNVVIILGIISFLTVYYKHHHDYIGIEKVIFAKPDPFIVFINEFAQRPFVLEKKEEYYVNTLSKSQLRILRNAILARKGYVFNDKDLNAFFKARKWYAPLSNNIELVEMDKTYTDIDRRNTSYITKLEKPENILFDDFVKLFKRANMPIDIKDEKYGNTYSKRIPIYFIKKFIKDACCPESQAVDHVYATDEFVVLLYRFSWAGVKFVLLTYSPDGNMISNQLVATYGGDISGHTTSTAKIDQGLNITIEFKQFRNAYDDAADKRTAKLEKTTTEKYKIDQKGIIKKIEI